MFPFPTEPLEFLVWLGAPASAGVIVSLLLERAGWFQALASEAKARLVFITFLVLPFASALGGAVLGAEVAIPTDPQAIARWALALALQGLTAWGASQYAHGSDPLKVFKSKDTV